MRRRTEKEMSTLALVMQATEILAKVGSHKNSVGHHLFHRWLVVTRPLLCDEIKTSREAELVCMYASYLETNTREEVVGWKMLMNSRPTNNILQAAFPTFIGWGRTFLG